MTLQELHPFVETGKIVTQLNWPYLAGTVFTNVWLPLIRDHLSFQTMMRGGLFLRGPTVVLFTATVCLTMISDSFPDPKDPGGPLVPHESSGLFCCSYWQRSVGRLTFNVRGQSYLSLIRSVSWLLMPCLLASPGHQQPWYWLCKICKSWSYTRKDFNYVCVITCLCSLWKI